MKLFLKISGIALLSFLIANGFYYLVEKGRSKYFYHTDKHFEELLDKSTNYDIVMLGSSRTHLHNDPKVIDNITGLNSYNAGIEGGSMMELNVVMNGYLEAHPAPKLVVMEVSMLSLNIEKSPASNPTFFLKHLSNKAVAATLDSTWKFTGFFKYLPFFRLSQYDDINKTYALKGFRGAKEPMYGGNYKGYAENSTAVITDTSANNTIGCQWVNFSAKGQAYLDDILASCKKKNVPVVLIYSPEYKQLNFRCPEGPRVIDSIAALAKQYDIPFWNYLSNPICDNYKLFANIGHLNKQGAEVFSAILGNDIKQYFATKK